MTKRLYYNDPGLLEFDAAIVSTARSGDSFLTILDRSAFYPTSGGQSADRGKLGEVEVTDVTESEWGDIVHVMAVPPGEVGDTVRGVIDEERRWRHRQMHTAQHIVSQLAIQLFRMETVSVHLGDDYGAVEFESGELKPEDLARLESEVNRVVRANATVEILTVSAEHAGTLPLRKVPTRSGHIRVIKIGELDWSACGGTHCNSTAQVGTVKLIGVEKMRGHTLLKFLSGAQAISDYRTRFEITDRLSKSNSCSIVDLPAKFEKLCEETKQLRKDIAAMSQELIPIRVEKLATVVDRSLKWPLVVESVAAADADSVSQTAAQVSARTGGLTALVCGDKLHIATPSGSPLHAGNVAKALSAKLGLRGGGSANAAQIGGVTNIAKAQMVQVLGEIVASA